MTEDFEIDTYLTISNNKFGIYLLDKKQMNTLYKEELNFEDKGNDLELKSLSNFLDENIFKIEKLLGKFVNNIFVVMDADKILNINMSLKKKNYDQGINFKTLESLSNFLNKNIFKVEKLLGKFVNNIFVVIDTDKILNINMSLKKKNYDQGIKLKNLEGLLIEAKDLFNENNKDYKIMHMLIKKYIMNGETYLNFISDLKSDSICIEVNFICIPIELSSEINLILDKYHIQINRFLNTSYINNLILNKEIETEYKISKVLSGYNENEVNLVLKNSNKMGFFEKFFQLFS